MSIDNRDLRKVWNVQLDLLEKFKSICKKYDLGYSASAGTLLGAVRHQGFIPWDDDIDLSMMWSDYKKFMEVAPKELEYPYFYQCPYTEPESLAGASRLRRSDTTGFTKWEYENVGPNYDKGIFIDIFPMFFVPDSKQERAAQKEKVMFYWKAIRGHDALYYKEQTGKVNSNYEKYIPCFEEYCRSVGSKSPEGVCIADLKLKYLDACAWNNKRTSEVGATSTKCHVQTSMWNTEWFESFVELPFENTTICCPAAYDEVLTRHLGNWRIPVKNAAEHEMIAVDPETPWRKFSGLLIQN